MIFFSLNTDESGVVSTLKSEFFSLIFDNAEAIENWPKIIVQSSV